MLKSAALVCFCTLSASAFTFGFSGTNVPVNTSQPYLVWEERLDVPLLTVSHEVLSKVNLEGCYGFRTDTEKEDNPFSDIVNTRTHVLGLSSFYTILSRGNAELRAGVHFLHSITDVEEEGLTDFKCTVDRYGPSARIDLSIPGLEEIGVYSQWGIDYSKEVTTYYFQGEEDYEAEQNGWETSGPQYILSGIYYSF